MIKIKIKVNTPISRMVFKSMKGKPGEATATTFRRSIHLQGRTAEEFVLNDTFLRHELQHAIQHQGIKVFSLKYVIETIKKGYSKNKYEVDAEINKTQPFPKGYLLYTDDLLCLKKEDYPFSIDNLTAINAHFGLKFKKMPKLILKA